MRLRKVRHSEDVHPQSEAAISHFQSHTAEITEAPVPALARGAVVLFAVMVVGAIALSAVLRVERVVVARGLVISQTPTIVVQPLETSVVSSIDVKVGDVVKQGQVLAALDPTISEADVVMLERRSASLDAKNARMQAEIDGVTYSPVVSNDDTVLQAAVYRHRMAQYKSSMANFDKRIEETQSQLDRNVRQAGLLSERMELLGQVVSMRATLEEREAGSRFNSIMAEDSRLDVANTLAESEGLAAAARHQLDALSAERDAFSEQWRADAVRELVTTRDEASQVKEELAKANYRRGRIALRAISDAVVLDVAKVSVGSVVEGAREIFRLVPVNAALELEVDIAGSDQGFVTTGDRVEIKFDAYPFAKHGTSKGRILSISEDSFTRTEGPSAGQSFYRARIEIESVGLREVPADFRLLPGMPVTADIVVGDRTILSSLTGGLAEVMSSGLREP